MKLTSNKHTASDNKNWEIHWNKHYQGKDKKSNTNAYGKKGHERKRLYTNACGKKERTDHKCLWQRKKDQTTNAGGKWKMAALIMQTNSWHQMKETKQLKPPQNTKQLPTCMHKVEKTHTQKHHQITAV